MQNKKCKLTNENNAATRRRLPFFNFALCILHFALCISLLALPSCQRSEGNDSSKSGRPGAARAVLVNVAAASQRDMPIQVKTYGTVQTVQNGCAQIHALVFDQITKVYITSGQRVAANQKLFEIDSRNSRAALLQAQAALQRDVVQLQNAYKEEAREHQLLDKKMAAPADYDNALATAKALAATTQADEAAIRAAGLRLEQCTILSPVDGLAGKVQIDEGNLSCLSAVGDKLLVQINQIQPIDVFFAIPQSDFPAVQAAYKTGRKMTVTASVKGDAAATTQPAVGELNFIDNSIDKSTGTVQLGARFPNRHERLWPGATVDVALTISLVSNATVVPAQAIQTGRTGKFIMVARPNLTVEIRPVTVAQATDEWAVVTDGVQPGERVITDGYFQLKKDSLVQIKSPEATTQPVSAGSAVRSGEAKP